MVRASPCQARQGAMQQRQPGKHHGGGSSAASEGGDSARRTRDGLNIPRPAPSLLRKVRDRSNAGCRKRDNLFSRNYRLIMHIICLILFPSPISLHSCSPRKFTRSSPPYSSAFGTWCETIFSTRPPQSPPTPVLPLRPPSRRTCNILTNEERSDAN